MKIVPDFSKIKKNYFNKNILIIGIFDGLHLGHQYLIKAALRRAKQIKAKSVVFTFWPHPRQSDSIIPIEERINLLKQFGIDFCIIKKFTPQFSCLDASSFIELIIKKINPKEIFVGENFHFGRGGLGNINLLSHYCKIYNINLNTPKLFRFKNEIISSSVIRSLIQNGNLKKAEKFLGRPVYIIGKVTEGKALGRKIGFPTANILPFHEILPPFGVYAVEILFKNKNFLGMVYIGKKPTIFHHRRVIKTFIEANIFDFNKYIYNKNIKLIFRKRIRSEIKFKDIQALKNQLQKDKQQAISFLSS